MQRLGLIGDPVGHSLSPRIFAWLFRRAGLKAQYELWPTGAAQLPQRMEALRKAPDLHGANVTIPHKQAVLPHLDALHASARRIGAVNCICKRDGRLEGRNTDVAALAACLQRLSVAARAPCLVILGAGGAARAAMAAGLRRKHWRVIVCARRASQARALERAQPGLELVPWAQRSRILRQCDILLNASAGGMEGMDALEIDVAALPLGAAVLDLVYRPRTTPLLRAAAARGLVSMDGLYMLIFQALENYRLWFPAAAALDIRTIFPALYQTCRRALAEIPSPASS